jgi:acid ceramidase
MLILDVLLNADNYEEAVDILKNTKINTPCYIIVGGINENEGIIITRNRDNTNHTVSLDENNWFVA